MAQIGVCFMSKVAISLAVVSMCAVSSGTFAQDIVQQRERVAITRPDDDRPQRQLRGSGAFGHLLQPDFQLRDMAILAQQLELDQSQRPIIEALLMDYREAFSTAAEQVQQAARRVRRQEPRFAIPAAGQDGAGPAIVLPGQAVGPVRVELVGEGEIELQIQTVEVSGPPANSNESTVVDAPPMMIVMTPDGMEFEGDIPPEMQEQLERIRERMERRREHMQERLDQWREREAEREAAGELLEASEIAAIAREFQATKSELRSQLVSDIKLMLTPLQLDQWPAVEMSLRRLNAVSHSQLSGEQVDLIRIIRALHLSEQQADRVQEILGRYALDLNDALVRRSDFLDDADIDRFEAMHSSDWDRLLVLADEESRRRIAVRSVNDDYAAEVTEALTEGHRERFLEAVFQRAFAQLARVTRAEHLIQQASKLDQLSAEQHERLAALRAALDQEKSQLNEKHRQQLMQTEPNEARARIEMVQRVRSGDLEGLRPPMMNAMELRRERMQFVHRYISELRAIVPQELMPELHEATETEQWQQFGETFRSRPVIEGFEEPRRRRVIRVRDQ